MPASLGKSSKPGEAFFSYEESWERIGSKVMWMRLCAVCKNLMLKSHLSHSVRCQCGWEWQGDTNRKSASIP